MKSTPTLVVTALVALATALAPVAAGATVAGPDGTSSDLPAPSDATAADRGLPNDAAASTSTSPHGGDHPPDPEQDVIGWEQVGEYGLWHNESIDVNNSDGLTQDELDQIVARTMARVEKVRQLEFQETVPVTVRSREQYRENVSKRYANVSGESRLHQNVKFEATFMVGEDTDTIAAQQQNRASSVLGFYSPTQDQIVIISDDPDTLQMNEMTLSHELAHALQDQHFNITGYNQSTEDLNNAVSGIVEGDAHYTEKLYESRCNDESHSWNGTCVRPVDTGGGGGAGDIHIGMFLISFQPYSDGPPFVHQLKQDGGWEAVNAVYDNPPASSEQVIHPDKYPEEKPADISIEDTSSDPWHVLDLNGSIDHATFGEGGLFAMFWYPSYETRSNQIIRFNDLFSEVQYDAYDYESRITDGWNGDRLLPYVTDESAETNETGYVWKLQWDSTEHADQFVDGYERMLEFRGGSEVDGHADTWRIPDDERFGDAFWVHTDGTTVVIVNAPTVEALPKVREGAAPESGGDPGTTTTGDPDDDTTTTTMDDDTTTADGTTDEEDTTTGGDGDGDGDGGGQGQPGFGLVATVVALLAAILLVRRRTR